VSRGRRLQQLVDRAGEDMDKALRDVAAARTELDCAVAELIESLPPAKNGSTPR
jgi:hypothetical protein